MQISYDMLALHGHGTCLGKAAVILARFGDVHAVVFEIVIQDQLADAVVLNAALRDGLLEITVEAKDLKRKHRLFL